MKPTETQLKGEHGSLETLKVKADNEHGHAVINAHEFDPAVHEKFGEPKAEKAKK